MVRSFVLLLFSISSAVAGLARYSDLVVADPPNRSIDRTGIRITYLGTNGYQLEIAGHSLLIDPYFSRISLARVGLGWPIRADDALIHDGLTHLSRQPEAILISHGHFDHLLDAPAIMRQTGAKLFGSDTAVELATRAGANSQQCHVVRPGSRQTVGPWEITVFPASHDRLWLMGVPFNRPINSSSIPPRRAKDWVCGEPLSYRIAASGLTVFIDSGGTPAVVPPSSAGPVDLAILGTALSDSRARLGATVAALHPRYFLPSHQDNFFAPMDRGFQFGPLTDFEFVRRQHQASHVYGRLILLDYFRPWTLTAR